MNPEELAPPEQITLNSIESSIQSHFPNFSPDRSRLDQPSSAGTRILEFHAPEGATHDDPIIYVSIQADPTTCSANFQHIRPKEGRIVVSGLPSYDFETKEKGVHWKPEDIPLMCAKLKTLADGV